MEEHGGVRIGAAATALGVSVDTLRRWERDGWLRRSASNVVLLSLYFLGVSPERLARWYRARP